MAFRNLLRQNGNLKKWDMPSQKMAYFHNMFKEEFNDLYDQAEEVFTKQGTTLRGYLERAIMLHDHLSLHHTIEERSIFPVLRLKIPSFGEGERHIQSHEAIHAGLETMKESVTKWKRDLSLYTPEEMKACLDGFREVLFRHLDEEVEDLRGENLKKYMTEEDLDNLPF